MENIIKENTNINILRSKESSGKHKITKMKDEDENTLTTNRDIAENVKQFYTSLYTSVRSNSRSKRGIILNVGSGEIPEITAQEINTALKQMKNRKSPGEDKIIGKMLKMAELSSKTHRKYFWKNVCRRARFQMHGGTLRLCWLLKKNINRIEN